MVKEEKVWGTGEPDLRSKRSNLVTQKKYSKQSLNRLCSWPTVIMNCDFAGLTRREVLLKRSTTEDRKEPGHDIQQTALLRNRNKDCFGKVDALFEAPSAIASVSWRISACRAITSKGAFENAFRWGRHLAPMSFQV